MHVSDLNTVLPENTIQNYINVKAYGAQGDGTSNDAPAVKKALEAAQQAGKTLYFPAGKYNLQNVNLTAKKDLVILGEASANTQLLEPGYLFCNGNVTVRNMSILDSAGVFLYMQPSKPVKLAIDKVIYTSPVESGGVTRFVYCSTDSATSYITRAEVTNCDISNCRYGIMLACKIDSGLIDGNAIYKIGNAGSVLSTAAISLGYPNSTTVFAENVTISNNRISNVAVGYSTTGDKRECHGILLYSDGGCVIQNNYLENITGGVDTEGIYCKAVDVKILHNTLINAGDGDGSIVNKMGTSVNNVIISGNTIVNNTVSSKMLCGIYITSEYFTVSDNTITMKSGIALYKTSAFDTVDAVIMNNKISTFGRTALFIGLIAGKALISSNKITLIAQSGEKLDSVFNLTGIKSTGQATVTDNEVYLENTRLFNVNGAEKGAVYQVSHNKFASNSAMTAKILGLSSDKLINNEFSLVK
jgi:parallel beta-helix repeat protein